jgi:hypothetical protein
MIIPLLMTAKLLPLDGNLAAHFIESQGVTPRIGPITDVQIDRHPVCQLGGVIFDSGKDVAMFLEKFPLLRQSLRALPDLILGLPYIVIQATVRRIQPEKLLQLCAHVLEELSQAHPHVLCTIPVP